MDPHECANKHQMLYKKYTPGWKETYRQRCRQRLKESREKSINRFRCVSPSLHSISVVESVMNEEWTKMYHEDHEVNNEKDIDWYLATFEEIRAELIKEEQELLAEYEASLQHEQAALESDIESLYEPNVICPICKKNSLSLNNGVILCQCGLRIETEQDCISLSFVKQSLEEGLKLHNNSCMSDPSFGVMQYESFKNLLITCEACDFMYIVV